MCILWLSCDANSLTMTWYCLNSFYGTHLLCQACNKGARNTTFRRGSWFFLHGGGVSTFPKNFDKQNKQRKKGGMEETGDCGVQPFPSSEVWLKSTFQTIIYIQVNFRGKGGGGGRGQGVLFNCKPLIHKHTVLILSGRGSGGPPPENVWL